MIRLAANLSTLFREYGPADRYAAAAAAGFRSTELQFVDHLVADEARRELQNSGLELVLLNAPAGDLTGGECGLATGAQDTARFQDSVRFALDFARTTGCSRVHVLAGRREAEAADRRLLVQNMRWAARTFAPFGVNLMIEPLNPIDWPCYAISTLEEADSLLLDIAEPNVALQFDLFHIQRSGGNLVQRFQSVERRIGHIQIAGVPYRNEPDEGELDTPWLLEFIQTRDYQGYVGCEYTPRHGTPEGLGWAKKWLDSANSSATLEHAPSGPLLESGAAKSARVGERDDHR